MNCLIALPINTERLVIDEFSKGDLPRLAEIAARMNDEEKIGEFGGYSAHHLFRAKTPNEIKMKTWGFLNRAEAEAAARPRHVYRMAMRLKLYGINGAELIGGVTVDMAPEQNPRNNVCVFVDPEHSGSGFATEGVIAASMRYFANYPLMNILVDPKNDFGIKIIEKIGGVQTDDFRSPDLYDGELRRVYAVAQRDFRAACENLGTVRIRGG